MTAVTFGAQTAASVGIAVAVVIIGWALNREAEHKRWLRQTRLEVYAEFLATAYAFDRQARLAERLHRSGDSPGEPVMQLHDIQVELTRVFDRMRLVGSGSLVRTGMTVLKSADSCLTIEEEDHATMAFVDADTMLASTYLEMFSAGVRREMGADGFWPRFRARFRNATDDVGDAEQDR